MNGPSASDPGGCGSCSIMQPGWTVRPAAELVQPIAHLIDCEALTRDARPLH